MDTGGRWPMDASNRTQGLTETSSASLLGPSVPYAEKAGTLLPADPSGCSKVNRASHDDDSPLSPPMAWSREGTSEELSKYQELQMRQQNDGHQHRTQDSGISTTSSNLAQPAKERLAGLVANVDSDRALRNSPRQEKRTSHLESLSNSWSRSVEASAENGQDSRRSTAHSATDSTPTRTPKSGRTRIRAKAAEDGDSSAPRISARSDRPRSYSNPHCQRQHTSGLTAKKTRCHCQSCQLEHAIITPPRQPYRYGQFLGSSLGGGSDPIPIYAGPLGLGDDIPSPTPSPPPPGRLSIHMAMSGQSPLGSPSGSPLFSLSHPFLATSPPSNRPSGTKTRSSNRNSNGNALELGPNSHRHTEKRGLSLGFSPTVANHPIVTGFQCQVQEPKSRGSKQEAEGDISPSLSPFFSSKRSFSPPNHHLSPTAALSTSPPMPAETLHAHKLLHEGASTSGEKHSNVLSHGTLDASPHFPRLAPPVVLVQSPTNESLSTMSERSPRTTQPRTDSSPLLYSSVLAASTPSSSSASTSASTSTSTSSPSPSASPASPLFSGIPRSPQQPLSPSGRTGAAATPPLSPSRKKEGYHPTLSSIEQKEFEAWSLTEQIQDRVVRTSPQLQYKSALLSGVGSKKLSSEQSRLQQPQQQQQQQQQQPQALQQQQQVHSRQQKHSPDTQQNSHHQHVQQNQHPRSPSSQQYPSQQNQQHQQPRSNRNQSPSPGVDEHVGGPHEASTTPSETRISANGSFLNVLRRSRSAPTLASGQLSYADILKASIKATSAPSLPTAGSGYVSLPSLDSSPILTSHPSSPVVSSGPSSQVLSSNSNPSSSAASGNQRSPWTVSLTPTRTMKPLRRLVLKNSKSDNNLRDRMDKSSMSAPIRSLLSSFQPISATDNSTGAVESSSSSESQSSSHAEERPALIAPRDCAAPSPEMASKDVMDARGLSQQDVEKGETSVPRAMSVEQGKTLTGVESLAALQDSTTSAKATTATMGAPSTETEAVTGLSFFRPPEELDELESSPEAVRHAQTIVAVSMREDSTKNTPDDGSERSKNNKDSDGSIASPLRSLPLEEKSFLSEEAPTLLVERKEDIPAVPAAAAAAVSFANEEGQDKVVQEDLSEPVQSTGQKVDDETLATADLTSAECPFQKQLAIQEQEERLQQVGTLAQDEISSQQPLQQEQTKSITTAAAQGEGSKSRRRRNNSSGGKKIRLKKKSSATHLHNSNVVQTVQEKQSAPRAEEEDEGGVANAATGAAKDHVIPPFYFPMGRPLTASKRRQKVLSALAKAREVFAAAENEVLNEAGFVAVTVQCCELPRYMNRALFRKVDSAGQNEVRFSELELAWESLAEGCPDEISMIYMILKQPHQNVLTPTDFEVVLQDLVLFHPGLEFLSGNAVFQERYLETVITRIFYEANRRHGKMSLADLRRSQFDKTLRKLENSDLNQTEDCFSYKHFYVIYCKFWELDQDHDLILDEQDLAGYSGGAISSRIIRRVMQGYGNETGMFMVPDQELLLQQQQLQQQLQQQQQQQQQQQLMLMQQRQLQQQDSDLDLDLEKHPRPEPQHGQAAEQLQREPEPSASGVEAQPSATKSLEDLEMIPSIIDSEPVLETDGSPVQAPKALRRSMTLSSVDLASIESADHTTTITFSKTDTDIEMSNESDMATSPADATVISPPTTTSPLMTTPAWTAAEAAEGAAAAAAAGVANLTPFVRTTPPGPGSQCHPQNYRMTYKGFIWFLLAETDKQTVTSIEYWFRCMDLDGDGLLTVFELEQLFQEQATRMAILGMESFGFRDAICQMQDLVSPKEPGLVRLADLKQCGQAGPFIDLFCNVVRWRSFEAHQHQIRMRQQQIAMQRAADAAWEEGEKLFNSAVDDEEGEDSDQEYDGEALSGEDENEVDEDDHSVSEQDEPDDDSTSEADEEGDGSCSADSDDPDGLLRNHTAGDGTPMAVDGEGPQPDTLLLSPRAAAAKQKALKRRRRAQERRQRKLQKQQQRQDQILMKRVLLEEQRKEKALLATIRESPWIVYVESEYEKLVTIERPQSRTEWDQEEEDDEEEDEEMEEEEEEEEVMDEEDMMMEEGRELSMASLHHQQHLQLQHQQFLLQQQQQLRLEQEEQLQLQQLQEGFSSQIEADVVVSNSAVGLMIEPAKTPLRDGGSHKMTVGTGTLMEVGQDFEQISMDSHSMETNGAGIAAISDVA